ncbi:MAG: molybdopterin molybdenumtransferase MoeA [Arcobacter sp.]|uniref:molybdopterin molybdotransferase MoeA n=1 Tax=uncultured Arcobacter sp. TaxID=165434 RepID=UPI000CAB2589|nr:molybdopterin molybdotransferase MoeA [uncultured Arcobacter sp.]PLY09206.1 MAG: molybdopterin molybdenumtransferase MoeA [Arcobacter sp.]
MNQKLNFLDFDEAFTKSLELANKNSRVEIVSISEALGRVISKDIICKKNLPSFDNSAMDGFAIKFSDAGKTLKINKVIFAGDKGEKVQESLGQNECYKIMTGAKVPSDADTIIPIENCLDVTKDSVTIPKDIKKGANLRLKGEEQKEGNRLFAKGEEINSSHITLLASQGIVMIEVYKKITIAVLSTGNEIKEPWENADEEEIYNCNSYALISQLKEKGFDATYCGVVPDSLEESKNYISNLKSYDVIITTGGISMGDADFVGEAFLQNGLETSFHGVNIKPGRPIMMGKMDKSVVICLPGNPLTAMVNIYLFVIPMLKKLQGANEYYHDISKATNTKEFKTKNGRVNIVLGSLKNTMFDVTRDNKYGSGMITALYESNSILVTGNSTSLINANQDVFVIEFNKKLQNKQINIFN